MPDEPPVSQDKSAADGGLPRWLVVAGALVLAAALALLVLQLVRALPGEHGPGRHRPPDMHGAGASAPMDALVTHMAP
jgi:hypothetical protein